MTPDEMRLELWDNKKRKLSGEMSHGTAREPSLEELQSLNPVKYGEQALEEPLLSPDMLIGTGLPTALAKRLGKGAVGAGKFVAPKANKLLEEYMVKSGMQLPATVWHGSPHTFPPTAKNPLGEFDASKIGTGEGAQAYGHGHYTGGARKVGETYKRAGSGLEVNYAKPLQELGINPNVASHSMAYDESPLNQALGRITKGLRTTALDYPDVPLDQKLVKEHFDEEIRMLNDKHPKEADQKKALQDLVAREGYPDINFGGNLYKVDLPDEHIAKMLDWDKPLSEQPHIHKALHGTKYQVGINEKEAERIAEQNLNNDASQWADDIHEQHGYEPDITEFINNADWDKYVRDARKSAGGLDSSMTGKDLYNLVKYDEGYRAGLFDPENYQVGTSEHLNSLGIPGNKYLDGISRRAGEGSSNYVVFPGNEDMLNILERNPSKAKGGAIRRNVNELHPLY